MLYLVVLLVGIIAVLIILLMEERKHHRKALQKLSSSKGKHQQSRDRCKQLEFNLQLHKITEDMLCQEINSLQQELDVLQNAPISQKIIEKTVIIDDSGKVLKETMTSKIVKIAKSDS